MSDDFAAVAAVAQPSPMSGITGERHPIAIDAVPRSFADRADRGVEILSRWAGIATFAAAVTAIAWFIF